MSWQGRPAAGVRLWMFNCLNAQRCVRSPAAGHCVGRCGTWCLLQRVQRVWRAYNAVLLLQVQEHGCGVCAPASFRPQWHQGQDGSVGMDFLPSGSWVCLEEFELALHSSSEWAWCAGGSLGHQHEARRSPGSASCKSRSESATVLFLGKHTSSG